MTKLVEVALPLEEISAASRADKDKKTGTIKNVHKWFAPMPTPAWRALLFASLVDDPGNEEERAELLDVIKSLVPKDGGPPKPADLEKAKAILQEATGGNPPTVFDPFCGGGSTLVEAQRLGLPCAGSDLNPVPVLITRTLTELLPQVAGRPPLVEPDGKLTSAADGPFAGFLADCRRYAQRVRDEVWDQVGHLYPSPRGGGTVIAWLWARTVLCPNPACQAIAPLVSSFWLSKKKGNLTWIEPRNLSPGKPVRFEVVSGDGGPPPSTKVGRGGKFRCVVCSELIPEPYVKAEGKAGRLGTQLMAVVVDAPGGRRYLSPDESVEPPEVERPADVPEIGLPDYARWFSSPGYGMGTQADLYTNRQLVMLSAFADSVKQVPGWVEHDGGDQTYARGIASVLGLCVSKLAMANSTQSRWNVRSTGSSKAEPAFGRHALPMVWDYVEANPFGKSVGDWLGQLASVATAVRSLPGGSVPARCFQSDARRAADLIHSPAFIATDPPYFAQIGYADLSDFFYVWLRRALQHVHPDLFGTIVTPKADELIAASYRHGDSLSAATQFFIDGFTDTFRALTEKTTDLPILIVYAHRQEESDTEGAVTSTAWDAMLSAIIAARLRIVGTWPIHGARDARQISIDANALASYMVLVCRPLEAEARPTDRQGFLAALHAELPRRIRRFQEASISTIDLGPAAIGPGMEVFSHFARVIEPDGSDMTVGKALGIVSQVTAEVLDEFVGDLDNETRWAMGWFRDYGFEAGPYDDAEKLCKTTVTSFEGLVKAGVATSVKGKVRLWTREELISSWSPQTDSRVTIWEVTQHLVKRLKEEGEDSTARLLRGCGEWADAARDLAQWLAATALASRPTEVLDLDALVTSWTELQRKTEELEAEPIVAAGRLDLDQ
jgi:putative DNA methylase